MVGTYTEPLTRLPPGISRNHLALTLSIVASFALLNNAVKMPSAVVARRSYAWLTVEGQHNAVKFDRRLDTAWSVAAL